MGDSLDRQTCCRSKVFRPWVFALLAFKALVATGFRCVYPFIPELAATTGRTVEEVSKSLSGMQATLIIGSFLAPAIISRLSHRISMACAALVFSVAMGALSFSLGRFSLFVCAIMVSGLTIGFSTSCALAIVSSFVDMDDRGGVVSFVELSWGLASCLGVPLVGFMMAADVRLPGLIMAALALIFVFVNLLMLPRAHSTAPSAIAPPTATTVDTAFAAAAPTKRLSRASQWLLVLTNWETVLAICVSFQACYAIDSVNINFGVWLKDVEGLSLQQVATASFAIGAADLTAEVLVLLCLVRLGMRPLLVMFISLCFSIAIYSLLPVLANISLALGLMGVYLCTVVFEVTVVSNMGYLAQISIEGTGGLVESLGIVAQGVGRILAALAASNLWNLGEEVGPFAIIGPISGGSGAVFAIACGAALFFGPAQPLRQPSKGAGCSSDQQKRVDDHPPAVIGGVAPVGASFIIEL